MDQKRIYLRYFYKLSKGNKEIINDSIYLLLRRIDTSQFYLDKYLNKKKEWTKKYKIELATDSLRVTERYHDQTGSGFRYYKEPYYIPILIE